MTAPLKVRRSPAPVAHGARPEARGGLKGEFYRQCRLWHGWLSAFAFLALIFFAATGLLLNHPEWLPKPELAGVERGVTLSRADLAAAQAAADPARALAEAVARRTPVRGGYLSGEIIDGEAMIRMEGVRGSTDVVVDLESGTTQVRVETSDPVTTLNELHRGKNAGTAWKAVIDASAILILALSLLGYVLFFSLRFRLATSLVLTGVSLAVMVAVFILVVP